MKSQSLSKKLLSSHEYQELCVALQMLRNKEYGEVYKIYKKIFSNIASIESYNDLMDYIESGGKIQESIFIFGYLQYKDICLGIGGFEEKIQKRLYPFIKNKIKDVAIIKAISPKIDLFTDYDGDDNFFEYVFELNSKLDSINMGIVVFFDDLYYQCGYHFFILDKVIVKMILKNWKEKDILLVTDWV